MTPYTIYLIDDDKFLLDMYALKFTAAGHHVTVFQGGVAGLEGIRKLPAPHAVLLDIVMPTIDGFGVLKTIREEKLIPDAKLIVLSNQGQPEDLAKAKEYNVDGYIIKASAIPSEVYSETIRIIESGKTGTA